MTRHARVRHGRIAAGATRIGGDVLAMKWRRMRLFIRGFE